MITSEKRRHRLSLEEVGRLRVPGDNVNESSGESPGVVELKNRNVTVPGCVTSLLQEYRS